AINFFATWCPPCRAEISELSRAAREYAGNDVMFVGLSVDENPNKVESFVKNMGVGYPVYMAGRDITGAYRVSGIPHNAFYSKNGLLMISEPGVLDNPTLRMIINKLLEF
ncbi:MAG: TlpA family protein disulfide reductase, partial [Desulfovibrio sp.]|nr:TlpA family protein disulfide reductase [Desulfovibrio sp.]